MNINEIVRVCIRTDTSECPLYFRRPEFEDDEAVEYYPNVLGDFSFHFKEESDDEALSGEWYPSAADLVSNDWVFVLYGG